MGGKNSFLTHSSVIKGVSRKYRYPENLTAREFEMTMEATGIGVTDRTDTPLGQKKLAYMNRINDALVKLNPELRTVRRTRERLDREVQFCAGTFYRFNPYDIDFHINMLNANNRVKSSYYQAVRKKQGLLTDKVLDILNKKGKEKGDWGWNMSPYTLCFVEKKLEQMSSTPKLERDGTKSISHRQGKNSLPQPH